MLILVKLSDRTDSCFSCWHLSKQQPAISPTTPPRALAVSIDRRRNEYATQCYEAEGCRIGVPLVVVLDGGGGGGVLTSAKLYAKQRKGPSMGGECLGEDWRGCGLPWRQGNRCLLRQRGRSNWCPPSTSALYRSLNGACCM